MGKSHSLSLQIFLALLLMLGAAGCPSAPGSGGGGEDKDPLKAAIVRLDAQPTSLKRGDRTLVHVNIREVDANGVLLKLRYTDDFNFVDGSVTLTVDGEAVEVSPVLGPEPSRHKVYLLFYLPKESFGETDEGDLTFQLQATNTSNSALIEVDVDLHDPTKSPASEFDIDRPLFGDEDTVGLEIDR